MGVMRRRFPILLLLALFGCKNPVDDTAKLDVDPPQLDSGWQQFVHEPAGFSFQAPDDYAVEDTNSVPGNENIDASNSLFVSSTLARDAGSPRLFLVGITASKNPLRNGDYTVYNLEELADQDAKSFGEGYAITGRQRIKLPVGPAIELTGSQTMTMPNGDKVKIIQRSVVFATAIRAYIAVYGYASADEAAARPVFDKMLRTIRFFVPNKDGEIKIPPGAKSQEPQLIRPRSGFVPTPTYTPPPAQQQPAPYQPAPTDQPPQDQPPQRDQPTQEQPPQSDGQQGSG
jgi:hypothetical protein